MKPYSESCDQNREPILAVIKPLLAQAKQVLEIGSGTGQHAVFFAREMPHLIWYTSDKVACHEGIQLWLDEADLDNTRPPIALDVSKDPWPEMKVDAIFSANAIHIMSWENVVDFFANAGRLLPAGAGLILYGPFNDHGQYSSESNARFDQWLKQRDPNSGIRDFEALDELAWQAGMKFSQDYSMPVNNCILHWVKT